MTFYFFLMYGKRGRKNIRKDGMLRCFYGRGDKAQKQHRSDSA